MTILGLALAAVVGLSLGLLGGGGSILTVPILVYVLGFEAKQAIAMSLAVVGTVSLFGAGGHWRAGNVDLRVAAAFGAVAMVGAFLGSRLASHVSGAFQLTLFAVVMLLAAGSMFRRRPAPETADARPAGRAGVSPPVLVAAGVAVGVLTGLVGVGGGFLIVPALVLLAHVPMKQAVGTSLLVIAMNSAAGFAGYLGRVDMAWGFMALFTGVAIAGTLAGARLVRRVPQHALQRAFAAFLVVMGGVILFENRHAIIPAHPPAAEEAQPRVSG